MKQSLVLLAILLKAGQIVSAQEKSNPLTISGYAEVYYQYDFSNPINNKRPRFVYSHDRNNEFNLNLGFIKAAYNTEMQRDNLAITAGTYMNVDYYILPNLVWRTEVKNLNSKDVIFLDRDNEMDKNNVSAISSIDVNF